MTEISSLGSRALLVTDARRSPPDLAHCVERLGLAGLGEIIPAAASLTITFDAAEHRQAARDVIATRLAEHSDPSTEPSRSADTDRVVELHCRFDGPDLTEVAETTGLGTDGVIAALTTAHLHVAFCGFSPGFAYLDGLPDVLHLPRRPAPRPRVDAGSVAIASRYAAVYPTSSPGGWHLLGSTEAPVWRVDREPPALLGPGTLVRLVDATGQFGSGHGG